MGGKVKRAKTAFQFYQARHLSGLMKELGAGAGMGTAMTELSARWKALSEDDKVEYFDEEAADRARFRQESEEADVQAMQDQAERRKRSNTTSGEMVAGSSRTRPKSLEPQTSTQKKKKSKMGKGLKKKKKHRSSSLDGERYSDDRGGDDDDSEEEEIDPTVLARRQQKIARDEAVADQHRKLDRMEDVKAHKRLEYLFQQNPIFAKLKMGGAAVEDGKGGGGSSKRKKGDARSKGARGGRRNRVDDEEDFGNNDDELEEDEDTESHVFLTKQPSCIEFGQMKDYQLAGLNWMIHLSEKGLNGILADEMGLGKTLQSISIMAYCYEFLKIQGPHLVCVPKTTLSNWMNEIGRWCPSLRALRFHGSKEERAELINEYFSHEAASHDGKRPTRQYRDTETGRMVDDNSDNPRKWDVCVTTYEICNTEKQVLSRFAWRYLIIDEAHRLKNESSIFSKTVREFHTSHRLLLTGTPLQNNLHELWALLNFLLPDIFSCSEQFDEWFNLEIDDVDAKKNMISQLHKILKPFMIRRLKSDVAKGLPPKTETLVMVGMSSMQKKLYKKLLLRDIDSITSNSNQKNKTAILNIVMQLRKCCGHPYLFEGVEDRTLDPLGEHLVENCGKLVMVDKLLKRLKERGSRVLIFTQMTRILDIMEDFLVMRRYKYCRIDGNTDYETRESSIEAFNAPNSEKFVFILSTRAGGLGINLQTADTCILYDSDWNPQADLQAQDRCHRIGQKKNVNIYRLVSENTIEEKIVERAQQKLKLDAMVVQQGRLKDSKNNSVSKDDMLNAIRFGADTVFRSEESTITDEDIDIILERGAAKTKELASKIQAAEKGDLLDFRLDAGTNATQTYEGIDYSDRELRNQLRLLAADSLGKRERKPPPLNYNPIIAPKKVMVVNNRKIKLPKSLRLPRMEDHQFYNRERLLELGKLEFQTYAALRQMNKLPPRETIDATKTLLPSELAQEKLDLLAEGFGSWNRSQYFGFVKASAAHGRTNLPAIAGDLDLPLEKVTAYAEAFWKYGATELKSDEWERAMVNIEKGENKIQKVQKLSGLLKEFLQTYKNPRTEMEFANRGTLHFRAEQDRALLTAVDRLGYGNWDAVREALVGDPALKFQHGVHGMDRDAVAKRCDYRMRQMERELEQRNKATNRGGTGSGTASSIVNGASAKEMPPQVVAAQEVLARASAATDYLENAGNNNEDVDKITQHLEPHIREAVQGWADRLREIEIQVRDCRMLAEDTRAAILRGDQYVNYSNITLKAGGPQRDNSGASLRREVEREERIHSLVLKVPLCGTCIHCVEAKSIEADMEKIARDPNTKRKRRKLCLARLEARRKLLKDPSLLPPLPSDFDRLKSYSGGSMGKDDSCSISSTSKKSLKSNDNCKKKEDPNAIKSSTKSTSYKRKSSGGSGQSSSTSNRTKPPHVPRPSIGEHNRGNPLGNKKMSVPDALLPEFCLRIGVEGTNERMNVIHDFVRDHPRTSIRQVTLKFSEVVTRDRPAFLGPAQKKRKGGGRAFTFYLKPQYYGLLPPEKRPEGWETYAQEDRDGVASSATFPKPAVTVNVPSPAARTDDGDETEEEDDEEEDSDDDDSDDDEEDSQ